MERPVLEEVQDPEPTVPVGYTRGGAPPVTFGDIIEDAPLPSVDEGPAEAIPDAHLGIPSVWETVDRVLDILLWRPKKSGDDETMKHQRKIAFEFGEQPSEDYVLSLDSWERAKKNDLAEEDIHHVAYAFFKWNDLGYEECEHTFAGVSLERCSNVFRFLGQPLLDSASSDFSHSRMPSSGSSNRGLFGFVGATGRKRRRLTIERKSPVPSFLKGPLTSARAQN